MSDLISRQSALAKAYTLDVSDTGNGAQLRVIDAEEIERLPAIHPNTSIHGSNNAKSAENSDIKTTGGCISRQAAIDAIMSVKRTDNLKSVAMLIMDLPSAQPERKTEWIPCSERLPEEGKNVLLCSSDGDIDFGYRCPSPSDEEWQCGEFDYDLQTFVAWAELPEPYKEDNK